MPADWSPAKRRQKDLEATWTKKHGKSTYGFKLSIGVNRKHKLIRKLVTDTASVHDSRHFEAVLDDWNTAAAWLPSPQILHPWPDKRFAVKYPRWEPSGVCQGSCRVSHFLSGHFILPLRVQIYRTDGCPISCAA